MRTQLAVAILLSSLGAACVHGRPTTAERRPASAGQGAARIRRVVTGFDAQGRSTIAHDGHAPDRARQLPTPEDIAQMPMLKFASGDDVWVLPAVPFDLAEIRDPVGPELAAYGRGDRFLPHRGSVFVEAVRYEPGGGYPMHASASLDVIVVTSGAMELVLETGSTIVRAGDVVIQRGTPHAWRVVGDQPCTFVSILADAVNSPVSKERLLP
jgi:quercetin dioxygenase-like cupin family protein